MGNVVSLCLYRQKRENDKLVEYIRSEITNRYTINDIKKALIEWHDRDVKLKNQINH